jgi:2-(1,2-epoxy-1,2-dihydrophenyl)acetyl-CoA isomerase
MSSVIVTTPGAGVARIAIDRPDKRNAVDPETRGALIEAYEAALADDRVHALLLGSEGGHFCAGGDIDSMTGLDVAAARARMKQNHRLVRLLAEAEKPVIAAVEGYAVGAGAGLALLADSIVLAEGGTIGFPFFRVGLTPDYGILYTLPRRLGAAKARRILFHAAMLRGADAIDAGLADELVPDGKAEERGLALALSLAAMPPHAFGLVKRHLAMAPLSLESTLEMEAMAQSLGFNGAEFAEGRAAFADKRKPNFR